MYKVVHNGMKIEYKHSISDVNAYIASELEPHISLSPKLKYNYEVGKAVFLCYEYRTLYCEMFLIEEID